MHNFKDFPELTNAQMSDFYFDSPHKQITADFRALVVKVHDGDTITLRVEWRNFDFPLRFLDINAPELKIDKIKNSKGE
jgi:endonuclease YncB( thermonuclease family)